MVKNLNNLSWLDSTWPVIVIIVQNIGIKLWVEANNLGSFFIGSYTNIFRIGEFFTKSDTRSSYSLNLDGFRSHHSTMTAWVYIQDSWAENNEKKMTTGDVRWYRQSLVFLIDT